MFSKHATSWLAGAAALAGTLTPISAYTANDVCAVDIRVLYTSGGGDFFNQEQTFTVTNDAPEGYLEIFPGTFTLAIDGKLCNFHPDHTDNGGTISNAFEGITQVSIAENEENKAVTVICLDKEQYDSVDQVVEMSPIIISVTIDNNVLLVGQDATVSVNAIDPNAGEVPGAYEFTMLNGGTVTGATGSCASGTCSAVFTASTGQSGNQPFDFKVKDTAFSTNGLFDKISGNIIVDDTGSLQFGLDNYHRPATFTVSTDKDELAWGEKATITIQATDEDIGTALADEVKLRGTSFSPNVLSGTSWTYPSNIEGQVVGSNTIKQVYGNVDITNDGVDNTADDLGCYNGDVQQVTKTTSGTTTTWVLEWNPWSTANSGVQADYGMASCGFTFQAFDSKNLLSDEITITLSATATAQDPTFDEIPMFEVIYVDDISPARGGQVELQVYYSDIGGSNQVDFELSMPGTPDMIASYTVDGGTSTSWTGGPLTLSDSDCTPTGSNAGNDYVSGCSHTFVLTIDAAAALGADPANVITLKITDAVSGYSDERVLNAFNVGSSRRARRDSGIPDAGESSMLKMDIHIAGGQLKAAVDGSISSEVMVEEETSTDPALIGGIVGGSVLAVLAVGVAVHRRRAAASAAAANIDLATTWDSTDGQTTIV